MLPGRKEVKSKNTAGKKKSFLSVWRCILKERRGGGGGWRLKVGSKNRKRAGWGGRKENTLNKNFIKYSVRFL